MRSYTLLVILIFFSLNIDVTAIIKRHDKPDSLYINLAKQFSCVGSLHPIGNGVVTLIQPEWVITAAHVAKGINVFNKSVYFGDSLYSVVEIYIHDAKDADTDIALLKLNKPVNHIKPAKLYTNNNELDKICYFVGWGDTGDGKTGPTKNDRIKRAATNLIASANGNWLEFNFDMKDNATELEGISGPGDSGGPSLWRNNDGEIFILGVSSYNYSTGEGECKYGSVEFYARISSVANWIKKTVKNGGNAINLSQVTISEKGWNDNYISLVAEEFFSAFAKGELELLSFEKSHRAPRKLQDVSAEDRVKTWINNKNAMGELTPLQYAMTSPTEIIVLCKNKWDDLMTFKFVFDTSPSPKLLEVQAGYASK